MSKLHGLRGVAKGTLRRRWRSASHTMSPPPTAITSLGGKRQRLPGALDITTLLCLAACLHFHPATAPSAAVENVIAAARRRSQAVTGYHFQWQLPTFGSQLPRPLVSMVGLLAVWCAVCGGVAWRRHRAARQQRCSCALWKCRKMRWCRRRWQRRCLGTTRERRAWNGSVLKGGGSGVGCGPARSCAARCSGSSPCRGAAALLALIAFTVQSRRGRRRPRMHVHAPCGVAAIVATASKVLGLASHGCSPGLSVAVAPVLLLLPVSPPSPATLCAVLLPCRARCGVVSPRGALHRSRPSTCHACHSGFANPARAVAVVQADFLAPPTFQYILRVRNTNIDGRRKARVRCCGLCLTGRSCRVVSREGWTSPRLLPST